MSSSRPIVERASGWAIVLSMAVLSLALIYWPVSHWDRVTVANQHVDFSHQYDCGSAHHPVTGPVDAADTFNSLNNAERMVNVPLLRTLCDRSHADQIKLAGVASLLPIGSFLITIAAALRMSIANASYDDFYNHSIFGIKNWLALGVVWACTAMTAFLQFLDSL